MLDFDFLEKGLGIVSPPYFENNFQEKLLSCYILLTDQISLPDCLYLLLEILAYMFIAIVC